MSAPWKVDDVADMQGAHVQFAHVARHLYRPSERWGDVIPSTGDLRRRACDAGCIRSQLTAYYPSCREASDGCREHVLRDHDNLLCPAYRSALREAAESGRHAPAEDHTHISVGDSGVLVIVRKMRASSRPEVKTAYRVVPRGTEPEIGDFLKAAVRKLRDKTSWEGEGSR